MSPAKKSSAPKMPAAPDRRRWRSEVWLVMSAPQSSHCCNYENSEQIISRRLRCGLILRETNKRDSSLRDPAHKKRAQEKAVSSRNSIRDAKEALRSGMTGVGWDGVVADLKDGAPFGARRASRRLKAPFPPLVVGGFHHSLDRALILGLW